MKRINKLCDIFCTLIKSAEEFPISRRIMHAVVAYQNFFNIKLIPGPLGSVGQIFFVENKPNLVIKFTTDSAEAKNMMLVYKIQTGEFIPAGMTSNEIQTIREGVIKVYNVFAFDFGRGRAFIIEQERGKDLPLSLSRKLLEIIGNNISKQPDDVFLIIQKKLSKQEEINNLSNILAKDLINKGQIKLKQAPDVNVGDLGNLLKVVRNKIDSSFRDFRPSNMVVTRIGDIFKIKLIDLGYGSGADIDIPVVSI